MGACILLPDKLTVVLKFLYFAQDLQTHFSNFSQYNLLL